MRHALKILLLASTLLLSVSAVWGQAPAGQDPQNPAPAAPVVEEAGDDRPIGVRLSEAASEFTRTIQGAERGESDVSAAQADEDRLVAELGAARQVKQTANDALGDLHGATRAAGEAVITLIREFLDTLPD